MRASDIDLFHCLSVMVCEWLNRESAFEQSPLWICWETLSACWDTYQWFLRTPHTNWVLKPKTMFSNTCMRGYEYLARPIDVQSYHGPRASMRMLVDDIIRLCEGDTDE